MATNNQYFTKDQIVKNIKKLDKKEKFLKRLDKGNIAQVVDGNYL